MSKDITLKILDIKEQRIRSINIDRDVHYDNKSDFAPYILREYLNKILDEKRFSCGKINATQEISKLIQSIRCFGGTSNDMEISTDTGERLFFAEDGSHSFLPKQDIKHITGFLTWIKQTIEKRKQKKIKAMSMATKA